MMRLPDSLFQDLQTLLRREADPRTGKLTVAPELAAWLEGIDSQSTPTAPVVEPIPHHDKVEAPAPVAVTTEWAPTRNPAPPSAPAVHTIPAAEVAHAKTLEELAAAVAQCRRCGLCETRTQTVFSDGNPQAKLVFVGEAPGEDEDRQGIPFVGRAGQLLTKIIEARGSMGLNRQQDVYICNVLKCRPPGNRTPHADEMHQCELFLVRQLELVRPTVICALGGVAAKQLLKTDAPVGRLRGKWHFYHGIPVRVTYHPSYLLRLSGEQEKAEKRKVLEDVQAVLRVLKGEEQPTG